MSQSNRIADWRSVPSKLEIFQLPTSVLSYTNHIYDRMRTSSMALGNTHGGCTSDHTYTGTKETT